jgi:hypothetical protein
LRAQLSTANYARTFTPESVHLIAVDLAEDCQGNVEICLLIKRLIETGYAGSAVEARLDIESGSIAIPTDLNRMLVP